MLITRNVEVRLNTTSIKPELLKILVCPECQNAFKVQPDGDLICTHCTNLVKTLDGKPIFSEVPATIEPWEKVERGAEKGTAWRKANWRFLDQLVGQFPRESLILDVGAGHGDFSEIFQDVHYFSMDIVPYPEVDLVCDLGESVPFKEGTFDTVVMMNVLEHVYENVQLASAVASIVKPGGTIIITVPFLLKVHQAPFDFSRYTPYYFERMAAEIGLEVERLDGFYDPIYLLNESLGNVWQYAISVQCRMKELAAKVLVFIVQKLINLLGRVTRKGFTADYRSQANPAPTGYLLVLKKP